MQKKNDVFCYITGCITFVIIEVPSNIEEQTIMSEEILTSVFTDLRNRFRRLAQRLLPDREDADDVLQEAFCRLWPKAKDLHDIREAEAVTTVTIRNLCIDTLRRQANRTTTNLDALQREQDRHTTADEALERKEQFTAIQRIIERELTPAQQGILQMKETEGLDVKEIADHMGMQPAAVRMQLSRARKTIRDCYHKTKGL